MHDAHPSPSETLRRAAELMRERAEAVPLEGLSARWFDAEASDLMHLREHDRVQIATFGHPAVALAVADWLDRLATRDLIECGNKGCRDRRLSGLHCPTCEDPYEDCPDWTAALAVARAYLGKSE